MVRVAITTAQPDSNEKSARLPVNESDGSLRDDARSGVTVGTVRRQFLDVVPSFALVFTEVAALQQTLCVKSSTLDQQH